MKLSIFNTLTRKKEAFEPIKPPFVGMYVCGPTVYGDPHLGHARPSITFDLLFRLLKALDFKVRYVRNITDVGHLEHDADEGEDKIAKKAKLEQLEPMEIAQYYTNRYRDAMSELNVLSPSIEPQASGHIIEQIDIAKKIIDNGFGYESNGSIYFDVEKYNSKFKYGILSGRVIEDQLTTTRSLDGQTDKRNNYDFALWKKASPEHIMRWDSPWSVGFPGWHLECTAMGSKYLGESFDIHGGGMDLMFPHHECEIAQNQVVFGKTSARYWMHNNMVTVNGQKMGKSLGNFITLEDLFNGTNKSLEQAYSPMTIRFFILQAQYRSTLDFSNDALKAAQKGYEKLIKTLDTLSKITPSATSDIEVSGFRKEALEAMCDDLNSPIAIAVLFNWTKTINSIYDGKLKISKTDLETLTTDVNFIMKDILGLSVDSTSGNKDMIGGLIGLVQDMRIQARNNKDWATSDLLRDKMTTLGITIKDKKEGFDWEI